MKKEMLENNVRSILLGDGHFLFRLKKKSTSPTWSYFDAKNKNGITLVALIITIILMLILAGVVINVAIGENGLFSVAKYSTQKYNEEAAKEKLQLALEDLRAQKYVSEDYNENEYIDDYLKSKDMNVSGNVVTVDGIAFEIDRENLTIIGKRQGYVIITSKLKERLENGFANILIKVESDKEIESITFPNEDGTTITVTTSKQTISKDLKVEIGKEYEVIVKTKDGEVTKETIKIELTKVRAIILNKNTLELAKGSKDETLQATVLPEEAEDKSLTWTSSDETIATVEVIEDKVTITGVKAGTANITVTANDGSGKSASCQVTVTPPPPPQIGKTGDTHEAKQIPYEWADLEKIAKVISDNYGNGEGQINEDTAEVAVSYGGIETTIGIGDWKTVNGKKVRILGFNHDNLVTTTTNEQGETITWAQYGEGTTNEKAGISFEYVDTLTNAAFGPNSYYNECTWYDSEIRKILNTNSNALINTLENTEQIKQVVKKYIPTHDIATTGETKDYLWLLACSEIWDNGYNGGNTRGQAITIEGKQYKYYKYYLGSTKYNVDSNITSKPCKSTSNGADCWTLRSTYNGANGYHCVVWERGKCGYQYSRWPMAIAPGFAI